MNKELLDKLILSDHDPDPEFIKFRDSLPATTWARKDLSAVRMGWEAHKALHCNQEPPK